MRSLAFIALVVKLTIATACPRLPIDTPRQNRMVSFYGKKYYGTGVENTVLMVESAMKAGKSLCRQAKRKQTKGPVLEMCWKPLQDDINR